MVNVDRMILIAGSPSLRLDVIRDLKAAGYIPSAPKEDDDLRETGSTIYVEDPGPGEAERVMEIARAADPSVELQQP